MKATIGDVVLKRIFTGFAVAGCIATPIMGYHQFIHGYLSLAQVLGGGGFMLLFFAFMFWVARKFL